MVSFWFILTHIQKLSDKEVEKLKYEPNCAFKFTEINKRNPSNFV